MSADEKERNATTDTIVGSSSRRKLIVAGPGTGKTTIFERLIDSHRAKGPDSPDSYLVLTFVHSLTQELQGKFGKAAKVPKAKVHTLHDYCREIVGLSKKPAGKALRGDQYYRELPSLIKDDWEYLKKTEAPKLIGAMRKLSLSKPQEEFYFERAAYYGAFADDDTIYRALLHLKADPKHVPAHELILVDEFQDFNLMEAELIEVLGQHSRLVIAGDDDQALYGQLRDATWDHIRNRVDRYDRFELPFCNRCPDVVVKAVGDVLNNADDFGKLQKRLKKPFKCYEPHKRSDTVDHPKIAWVQASEQGAKENHFGEHIAEVITNICTTRPDEVQRARKAGEPLALIIGRGRSLSEISTYLEKVGLPPSTQPVDPSPLEEAYRLLDNDPRSNLGWRIFLACSDEERKRQKKALKAPGLVAKAGRGKLVEVIDKRTRTKVLVDVKAWAKAKKTTSPAPQSNIPIECISVEKAKGKAAQYVFLVDLDTSLPPKDPNTIKDMDICRFLVGLTRTRTKCTILTTTRRGHAERAPSPLLSWISRGRFDEIPVGSPPTTKPKRKVRRR